MLKKIFQNFVGPGEKKPVAVQCLWNSDWDYIGLSVELVYKDRSGYQTQKITELAYQDFATEKELVQEVEKIAKEYTSKYNVELYFPSPDEWSRDCPNWWDSHTAFRCEDCKTPIIPTTSEYLPKEVCYPCHLARERNAHIKNALPSDDGVTMYLYKDGNYEKIGYCTRFESFTVAPFVKHLVKPSEFTAIVNVVTVERDVIENMCSLLELFIDEALLLYEKPNIQPNLNHLVTVTKIVYKGSEVELMDRFNEAHKQISKLLHEHANVQKALNENYLYKIFFKKDLNSRDDSILRYIHFGRKNIASKEDLLQKFENILSESEIMESVGKLVKYSCIEIKNSEYSVTELALKII